MVEAKKKNKIQTKGQNILNFPDSASVENESLERKVSPCDCICLPLACVCDAVDDSIKQDAETGNHCRKRNLFFLSQAFDEALDH